MSITSEHAIPNTSRSPSTRFTPLRDRRTVQLANQPRATASVASSEFINYLYNRPVKDKMFDALEVDLANTMVCKATSMLKYLLAFCCTKEGDPVNMDGELNEIFEQLKNLAGSSEDIKVMFSKVPFNRGEDAMYEPLVRACNYAFYKLSKIESQSLPEFNESEQVLMISRNAHPVHPEYSASGLYKPDLCIVKWKLFKTQYKSYRRTYAVAPSEALQKEEDGRKLVWRNVLCPIEVNSGGGAKVKRRVPAEAFHDLTQSPLPRDTNSIKSEMPREIRPEPLVDIPIESAPLVLERRQTRSSTRVSNMGTTTMDFDSFNFKSDSKKRKRSGSNPVQPSTIKYEDPRKQLALYAAHRSSAIFDITHTVSILLRGRGVTIVWYDRQSAIESYEFDFIRDLPHFLLLLLIFQRFNLARWGYATEATDNLNAFKEKGRLGVTMRSEDSPNALVVQFYPLHHVFCHGVTLIGRATAVMGGTAQSEMQGGSDVECVVKSYWPEDGRTSEVVIMKQVEEKAKEDEFIQGHVPQMLSYLQPSFPGSNTKTIREFLRLGPESLQGTRQFTLIALKRLHSIFDLEEEKLVEVFIQVMFCHRALWVGGIFHSDISLANILYDKETGKGVLSDFDLARLQEISGPTGYENTGTLPFMALELLTDKGVQGLVPRRYRHDAEGFAWVLAYLCLAFELSPEGQRQRKKNNPLYEWMTNYTRCYNDKYSLCTKWGTLDEAHRQKTFTTPYPMIYAIAYRVCDHWIEKHRKKAQQSQAPANIQVPEANVSDWEGLLGVWEASGLEVVNRVLKGLMSRETYAKLCTVELD